MNLGQQLASLKSKGFDEDHARLITLIREAAIVLFRAFPDSFVIYGGANLILFHDSLRTSRDLDLLAHGSSFPSTDEVTTILSNDLQPLGSLLGIAPLKIAVQTTNPGYIRLEVLSKDDRTLFTVDLGGIASLIQTGVEEHLLEAVSLNTTATVRSVSRGHLLLQKAEAFAFRPVVKIRDAYDINLLMAEGAVLSTELQNHLADALMTHEIGTAQLLERIDQVTPKLCRAQLADVLPESEYKMLQQAEFQPLKLALRKLFQKWI